MANVLHVYLYHNSLNIRGKMRNKVKASSSLVFF